MYGVITCAGTQSIKVHGSFKKFTISYFNGDESIEPLQGNWHFYIQGQEISHLINVKTEGLQPNEVKVKFIGEPIFIGQLLTVRYIPRIGDAVELTIPVVSL